MGITLAQLQAMCLEKGLKLDGYVTGCSDVKTVAQVLARKLGVQHEALLIPVRQRMEELNAPETGEVAEDGHLPPGEEAFHAVLALYREMVSRNGPTNPQKALLAYTSQVYEKGQHITEDDLRERIIAAVGEETWYAALQQAAQGSKAA